MGLKDVALIIGLRVMTTGFQPKASNGPSFKDIFSSGIKKVSYQ